MEEGKKWSQMKDSETFAFIAYIGIITLLLMLAMTSCNNVNAQCDDSDRVYILIDGRQVELVADEYGGQYLKQESAIGIYIYIPYIGETEDTSDTLHFYNAKNK